MLTLAQLTLDLRQRCDDAANSNFAVNETPDGLINGTNTIFRVKHRNVVPSSVFYSTPNAVSPVFRSNSGLTETDDVNGLITMTSAPAAGSGLVFEYFWNWFPDADHQEFLNGGSRWLLGSEDPTTIPDGLINALLYYAKHEFCERMLNKYAYKYDSSTGQLTVGVKTVAERYMDASKAALKSATDERDNYYKGQGGQYKAAMKVGNINIDPITPSH